MKMLRRTSPTAGGVGTRGGAGCLGGWLAKNSPLKPC
jgi:hypothetical protein